MKKTILLAATCAFGAFAASAQAIEQPRFFDNWSMGLDGGVTTPLTHHAFFGNMRGLVGLHVDKQVTPAFAIGAEAAWGVNTSTVFTGTHSSTAFDNSYVGMYGAVDLFNLFGGYNCEGRPFSIEAVAGAGWGHEYFNKAAGEDWNYFATKVGLNFNFNVNKHLTIALKPSIVWNMSDAGVDQTSAAYNANKAAFNLQAGVTYHFGNGFQCVQPYNQAEIDALNGQINDLRASLDACMVNSAALEATAATLAADLEACKNRPVQKEVVKEVSNNLSSVRFVFFRIGSSKITADQQPNVEMIASFLKNHPKAKVVIKGYASQDGNLEFNQKLAAARAESVKNQLIKKYKIASDRIVAEGEGIGHMFEEESWNRVSICTIENAK